MNSTGFAPATRASRIPPTTSTSDFGTPPNWIVLHDLRLTGGTDVVQIDHLLINRVMEFFILETKRFQGKTLRITEEGEFLLEENPRCQGSCRLSEMESGVGWGRKVDIRDEALLSRT